MKLKSTKQWLTGLNRLKIYPLSIKCRRGFPWQSSGYDLALPLQVGELRSFMPCGGTNKSNDSENSQKAGCSGLVCKGQEVIRDLLSAAHALPCLVCCRVSPHPCGPRGLLEFQHRIFRSVKWMQGWQPQQQYLELSFVMTTHTLASHGFFLFFFSHASQTHLSIWQDHTSRMWQSWPLNLYHPDPRIHAFPTWGTLLPILHISEIRLYSSPKMLVGWFRYQEIIFHFSYFFENHLRLSALKFNLSRHCLDWAR